MKMEELLAVVEMLNGWCVPGIGRTYQRQLLTSGTLQWGGRSVGYASYAIDLDRFLLRPVVAGAPWFVTTDCGRGWEIIGVVDGDDVVAVQPGPGRVLLELETAFLRSRGGPHLGELPASCPWRVRLGHGNFAHLIWNNLPATILWEELILRRAESDEVRCELAPGTKGQLLTLASLPELLPKLADRFVDGREGLPEPNTLRLGSVLVSEEARARVMASLRREPTGDVRHPRLWLGVRHPADTRSPENLDELYVEVGRRWLRETSGDLVLDGYTLEGFGGATARDHERRDRTDPYVRSMVERLEPCASDGRLRSTAGFTLRESIALAGTADYYVSCPGTIQHKIGWVWNKPGIVLNPPVVGREHHTAWPGRMVAAGLVPDDLPVQFVRFVEAHAADRTDRLYDPFVVADPSAAAAWVVRHALRVLGER